MEGRRTSILIPVAMATLTWALCILAWFGMSPHRARLDPLPIEADVATQTPAAPPPAPTRTADVITEVGYPARVTEQGSVTLLDGALDVGWRGGTEMRLTYSGGIRASVDVDLADVWGWLRTWWND